MAQAALCLARPWTVLSRWPGAAWSLVLSGRSTLLIMEAFLVSTGVVALAEIGDKTQLLAFLLAARFKKPTLIIFAILLATLVNHAFAGLVGAWVAGLMTPETLRWVLGISFVLMALWILVPDKPETVKTDAVSSGWEIFTTTLLLFFLAEMGDKTQIATVALTAQYQAFFHVVAGTTLGMMVANVPAVLLGGKIADRIPARLLRVLAALIFLLLGVAALLSAEVGVGGW